MGCYCGADPERARIRPLFLPGPISDRIVRHELYSVSEMPFSEMPFLEMLDRTIPALLDNPVRPLPQLSRKLRGASPGNWRAAALN